MTSALLISFALALTPSPLTAQIYTDDALSPSSAVASSTGLSVALAQWNQLRQSTSLPFDSYASFLIAHPGWPAEAAIRKSAEGNLRADSASSSVVAAYFGRFAPTNATTALRQAEALSGLGRADEARTAARRAWTMGALSDQDEARLLNGYGASFTSADQDLRMDRLLWQRAAAAAARQLPLTSLRQRAVFDARLALQMKSPDAADKLADAGDRAQHDAGAIADHANWLRASGDEGSARALLAAQRSLATPPLEPGKWLDLHLALARGAAAAGDWGTTVAITRAAADAYPSGVSVRDQSFGERNTYTDLTALGGMAALNHLARPTDAIALFESYARAGRSPQVQAKGLYWAGRAAEAAGHRGDATDYFQRAAVFFDQFYGQLAGERLGAPLSIPPVTRTIEVSANDRDAFFRREIVRMAGLLGSQGDWATQSLFIRAIAAGAQTDIDHALAVELSMKLARPDLAVMIGRSAGANGLRDYVRAGFPTIPVSGEGTSNWTIIHAIARQESQFDREIVSKAGARGLMQLMPGTARDAAGKIGVSYTLSSLDDPAYNLQLGSWYFARLMDRFNGSYVLSVAAYNAGAGNVNKWLAANGDPRVAGADVLAWIEAIPFRETRDYVQRVLENAVVYDLINPTGRSSPRNLLSRYLGKTLPG